MNSQSLLSYISTNNTYIHIHSFIDHVRIFVDTNVSFKIDINLFYVLFYRSFSLLLSFNEPIKHIPHKCFEKFDT